MCTQGMTSDRIYYRVALNSKPEDLSLQLLNKASGRFLAISRAFSGDSKLEGTGNGQKNIVMPCWVGRLCLVGSWSWVEYMEERLEEEAG